jgi:hypothetical protein
MYYLADERSDQTDQFEIITLVDATAEAEGGDWYFQSDENDR